MALKAVPKGKKFKAVQRMTCIWVEEEEWEMEAEPEEDWLRIKIWEKLEMN